MMRKLALIPVIIALAVMLLIYPENCLSSARYGLELWLTAVLPSLLPFMAASFLLLETGIVRLISMLLSPVTRLLFYAPGESAYVFIASAVSGYPVGARLSAELFAHGEITEPDAQRMIRFTSVTGPVFLTGAVSAGLLGLPSGGFYLAAAHYISAIIVGVIMGIIDRRRYPSPHPQNVRWKDAWRRFKADAASCPPVGTLLSSSVEKSLWALLKIGGFIILSCVTLELLSVTGVMDVLVWLYSPLAKLAGLDNSAAAALLAGGVEITAGCARVAALNTAMSVKLILCSGIVTFGGLSVHMQTRAVCAPSGLVLKRFVITKTIQGTIASALTALLLAAFPLTQTVSTLPGETKIAAFGGVIFAVIAIIAVLLVRLWQRAHPSASCWKAQDGFVEEVSDSPRGSVQSPPVSRRHIPWRRP